MPDWQIQLNLKIHPFIEVIIANKENEKGKLKHKKKLYMHTVEKEVQINPKMKKFILSHTKITVKK